MCVLTSNKFEDFPDFLVKTPVSFLRREGNGWWPGTVKSVAEFNLVGEPFHSLRKAEGSEGNMAAHDQEAE